MEANPIDYDAFEDAVSGFHRAVADAEKKAFEKFCAREAEGERGKDKFDEHKLRKAFLEGVAQGKIRIPDPNLPRLFAEKRWFKGKFVVDLQQRPPEDSKSRHYVSELKILVDRLNQDWRENSWADFAQSKFDFLSVLYRMA